VRQKKVMNEIENVQIMLLPLYRSLRTNNVSATYKEEKWIIDSAREMYAQDWSECIPRIDRQRIILYSGTKKCRIHRE
jgi:hypothetical protein